MLFFEKCTHFYKTVIMRSCVSAHAYYFNCMRAFLMYFNIFLSFFDDHAVKHPPPFSTISTYLHVHHYNLLLSNLAIDYFLMYFLQILLNINSFFVKLLFLISLDYFYEY